MKDLSNLPWKSKLFTYGVIAIFFGSGSVIYSFIKSKPNINNSTFFSGTLVKIENMQVKTKNATVMHLEDTTNTLRINMGACSSISAELYPGDNLNINYIKSSLALLDGRAMQISKDNLRICDFEKTINKHNRSVTLDLYFGLFCLTFGSIGTYIGYKKT